MMQFDMNNKSSIFKGLFQLASAFTGITVAVDKCDKDVTQKEIEIFNHMLKAFSNPKSTPRKSLSTQPEPVAGMWDNCPMCDPLKWLVTMIWTSPISDADDLHPWIFTNSITFT